MPVTMRRGAFALIDVLGFKGIWRRHPAEAVVESLEALMDASQEAARLGQAGVLAGSICAVSLSDTVAFGLTPKSVAEANAALEASGEISLTGPFNQERLDSWAVWHMANFLAQLMRRAFVGRVPLAFRGAVAFGTFGMTDRFVIGEAVDEAAQLHETPNAAIVGLTESAARFGQAEIPSSVSKYMRYPIPTKKNGPWNTWAVLPWGEFDEQKIDLVGQFEQTLVTDDPRVREDVECKRKNTLDFLRAADEAAHAFLRALVVEAPRP